jgi:hypothetical protein
VVKHFCDSCGRELRQDGLAASNAAAIQFLATHPEAQGVMGEVWCAMCLPRAEQYWTEKLVVVREVMDVSRRRLENFRKQFWAQRPLQIAKAK